MEAHLEEADLSNAYLNSVFLDGAFLHQANLSSANLGSAFLEKADLTEANLSGANLSNANLNMANLHGSNLSNTNLDKANLSRASISEEEKEQLRGKGAIGLDDLDDLIEVVGVASDEKNEAISNVTALNPLLSKQTMSAVQDNSSTLLIRITEEPLTAQNLTAIISALIELYTKCWLIQQGRFPDLIYYTQTHDIRFTKEANLTIGKLDHNSPTLVELILNPTTIGAIAGAVVTIAGSLKIAIDNIGQTSLRFKEKELDIDIRRKEAQQAQQTAAQNASLEGQKAQLEIEKLQLEIERERLEVEKSRIEVALETANRVIDKLRPGIDKEIKGMLVQALLSSLLQLGTTEGLELVDDGNEELKERNQA